LLCFVLACGGSKPQRAPAPPPRAPPPADAAVVVDAVNAAVEMPADCQAYMDALDKLAGCPKLPPDSRDAMAEAVEQLKAQLPQALSPEARANVIEACKQANDAIKQAFTSAGC
jgi:hypothetical protein